MRLLPFLTVFAVAHAEARLQLVWPTPNTAYLEGKPLATYVQPTVSGEVESGLFGGVRSEGLKFHEGLDLLPLKRDKAGEATDPVFAITDGIVRHVSTLPGNSSYGRYIVIEHPGATPAFCSLYAHLKSASVRIGDRVARGQEIGIMGRSAGGYGIPKDRAHLHLEMALMITTDFQRWYDSQKFGSPNHHSNYNGMNLMGVDPKDFYDQFRAKRVNDLGEYLAIQPVAVTVRVARSRMPDFVTRYPSLLQGHVPVGTLGGWEIDMLWTGLPVAFRPLDESQTAKMRPGSVEVVKVNESLVTHQRSIRLVRQRGSRWTHTGDMDEVLGKLF